MFQQKKWVTEPRSRQVHYSTYIIKSSLVLSYLYRLPHSRWRPLPAWDPTIACYSTGRATCYSYLHVYSTSLLANTSSTIGTQHTGPYVVWQIQIQLHQITLLHTLKHHNVPRFQPKLTRTTLRRNNISTSMPVLSQGAKTAQRTSPVTGHYIDLCQKLFPFSIRVHSLK